MEANDPKLIGKVLRRRAANKGKRVGDYMRQAADTIARLRVERDSARRMVCRQHVDLFIREEFDELGLEEAARIVAKEMDWDCFKEVAE